MLACAKRKQIAVHVIDRYPALDVDSARELGGLLMVHADSTLRVLQAGRIHPDLALIDTSGDELPLGSELELLDAAARKSGVAPPIVVLQGTSDLHRSTAGAGVERLSNGEGVRGTRTASQAGLEAWMKATGADPTVVEMPSGHGAAVVVPAARRTRAVNEHLNRLRDATLLRACEERDGPAGRAVLDPRSDVLASRAALEERVGELQEELARALARVNAREAEAQGRERDLTWYERQLALRNQELGELRERVAALDRRAPVEGKDVASLRQRVAKLDRELAEREDELAVVRRRLEDELAVVRRRLAVGAGRQPIDRRYHGKAKQQWAAAARRIERSATWRLGHAIMQAFRLVTLRGRVESPAPAALAASIEAFAADIGSAERPPDPSNEDDRSAERARDPSAGATHVRQHALVAPTEAEGSARLLAPGVCSLLVRRLTPPTVAHEGPSVDVVICVHDALEDLQRCLASVLHAGDYPHRLILVDDGSSDETRAFLSDFARQAPGVELVHRSGPAHGYTLAANAGLRASSSDYVILLNSDTIVGGDWIRRLLACAESSPAVGAVGPLSNAASYQSVPRLRAGDGDWAVNELPDHLSVEGMSSVVASASPTLYPRVPFLNGFCLAIKRDLLEAIGEFDEQTFPDGYCEESDFCIRARSAGFELAVADDAFVFHAKSRSYASERRLRLSHANFKKLIAKHGREALRRDITALEDDQALAAVRRDIGAANASPAASMRAIIAEARRPICWCIPAAASREDVKLGVSEAQFLASSAAPVRLFGSSQQLGWLRRKARKALSPGALDSDDPALGEQWRGSTVYIADGVDLAAYADILKEHRDVTPLVGIASAASIEEIARHRDLLRRSTLVSRSRHLAGQAEIRLGKPVQSVDLAASSSLERAAIDLYCVAASARGRSQAGAS